MKRIFLIVLDGVGIGALPDADLYGDEGSDTLGHLIEACPDIRIPNLTKMGIRSIRGTSLYQSEDPAGIRGRCAEASVGKDTTTGHWEMMGIIRRQPFPTYPEGFPPEIIEAFEKQTGRGVLANRPASGTRIIAELGEEHQRTGRFIVYTSADSVFQIAAHIETVSLEELYDACEKAREILKPPHGVSRVIARPFAGNPGHYYRTEDRRDFSLSPTGRTVLGCLTEAGIPAIGVGKIHDIFSGNGLSSSIRSHTNEDNLDATLELMQSQTEGLIFVNLVEFDMLYGHRRDTDGFAACLEDFDESLGLILERMKTEDLLIVTADHGCDPVHRGTDHTREYIPLLVHGGAAASLKDLGDRSSFADIGQSILRYFELPPMEHGNSFL